MKNKYWVTLIIITAIASFFAGRATVETKETVRFIKGETIIAEYPSHLLLPKREIKGFAFDLPAYYFISDTIVERDTIIIQKKADTIKVFNDFLTKREYDFTLFDNEYGIVTFQGEVQFNKLQKARGFQTPIQKEITKHKKDVFTPFAFAGANTLSQTNIGAGIFMYQVGLSYEYIYDLNKRENGHGLRVFYKF